MPQMNILMFSVFSDFDTDEIPTYEEVELYRPKQPLRVFRPIIFIGMLPFYNL